MFASVGLGMAVNLVFPDPIAVTVATTMAGTLVAALKAPVRGALYIGVVQMETSAVVAVAAVVSAVLTALVAFRAARHAATDKSPSLEHAP